MDGISGGPSSSLREAACHRLCSGLPGHTRSSPVLPHLKAAAGAYASPVQPPEPARRARSIWMEEGLTCSLTSHFLKAGFPPTT